MACQHPPIPHSPGGKRNWIENTPPGHLPEPIDCLARAFYWQAGSPATKNSQKAYEMAVGIAEDYAAGRRKISKAKQVKYIAAVSQFKAMAAASKARTAAKA